MKQPTTTKALAAAAGVQAAPPTPAGPPVPNLITRLLALMGQFEGSKDGTINVWDEQYLSVGTLHFAVRAGSGYRFLRRIYDLDPVGYAYALGKPFAEATANGQAALTEFCRVNVWKKPNTWQPSFRRLARRAAYDQADRECAQSYIDGAIKIAKRYGLTSERGLAFALDRCVQQGPQPRRYVDLAFLKLPAGLPEYQVMKVLARAYAETAKPKYKQTVLQRSLTVALGNTTDSGYPANFTLFERFGIRPDKAWAGQV